VKTYIKLHRTIFAKNLVKAMMVACVLAAMLVLVFGCGGSQQSFAKREATSEPSTSASEPLPPSTQQLPSQDSGQNQALPERYQGLEVGEPAKFKNGLVVVVEGASLVRAPAPLTQLGSDDRLVAMRFSLENATPEGQISTRHFKITAAQWQALNQNGDSLNTIYSLEATLEAGEISNPSPDYPYLGWQGELSPGQRQQGSVLFAVPPSVRKIRVRFTQPVMSPPYAEWALGTVAELHQAP
jgi:hypothetical protein